MHRTTTLAIAAALVVLGFPAAMMPATVRAYDAGQVITDQPEVVQAMADARAYWHDRAPACRAGGVVVATADIVAEEAATAGDCNITVATWWLNVQPAPDRTRWCALFAHEYGHLLGYAHEDYREDTDRVMSKKTTPQYCRTFNAPPDALPKVCRWPAWARTTPQIRRLYAAGRVLKAGREFRAWRRKHPKAPLPGPCVAATS